ncbi:hypothetical protein PLESTM_001154700 [Pleodorina starrii]|nr:hypothetical protein PLESTM_001154700 [Pleodorina starrii]
MPHARREPSTTTPQPKSVAVIGGGLAGLSAAKAAVQAGLLPTIFDRRPSIGGMWGDAAGATYASLHTNVSRFTCSFSDFPWPPGSPDFPTAAQVGDYLSAYQRAFLPPDKCRLRLGCEHAGDPPRTEQTRTEQQQQLPWVVEWHEAQPSPGASAPTHGSSHTQHFDFVVVASGFCAAPRIPSIPGLDSFPGLLLHSAAYRGPHSLRLAAAAAAGAGRRCRRVAVVGAGHSAADIAADIAAAGGGTGAGGGTAAAAAPEPASDPDASVMPMEVIHVTPRPFWVLPRYLPLSLDAAAPPFAPLDVMCHRWSARPGCEGAENDKGRERLFASREERVKDNAFWATVCGDQGALLSPALAISPGSSEPMVGSITDCYGPLVASGRLKVLRGRLHRVEGSTLELSGGPPGGGGGGGAAAADSAVAAAAPPPAPLRDVDAIVLCTGMRPSLSFLPAEVLETLSYTPYDDYVPLALHRQVLHPDVPGLAFVGVFRSPFFAVVELQARLAAAAAAGTLPAAEADPAAQRAGVDLELRVRQYEPRTPYPRVDFVGHADGLAAALGVRPPAEWRAAHDVIVAAHYGVFPGPSAAANSTTTAETQGGEAAAAARTTAAVDDDDGDASAAAAAAMGDAVAAAPEGVRRALDDVAAAMRSYRGGHRVASAVFHDLAGEWALHRRIVSRLPSSPSGEVTGRATFTATAADTSGVYSPAAGGAGGLSYLYEEQGQFAMLGGPVMRVRREYVYAYDSTADRIDVFFAEGGSRRGAFFHSLRFLPPEEQSSSAAAAAAPAAAAAAQPAAATSAEAAAATAAADVAATDAGGASAATASSPASPAAGAAAAAAAAAGWRAVGEHLCVRDMYDASYRFSFQGLRLRQFEIEFRVKGPNKDYTATATYTRQPGGGRIPYEGC